MAPLRVVVIFLIFSNLLALALWKGLLGGGAPRGEPERVSNQLNPERIRLVSEPRSGARPPLAASAPPVTAPVAPPVTPPAAVAPIPASAPAPVPAPAPAPAVVDAELPGACVAFTGLSVDQARELTARIGKAGGSFKLNEKRSEQPSSWWVFIPSPGSKAGAERKVEELRRMGVEDLFIVPDAGPSQFSVSLGLYRSEAAAARQLAALRAKGVQSAQVATRGVLISLEIRGPGDRLATLASDLSDGLKGARRLGCTP